MAKESKERINQSGKFDNRRIVTENQISIKILSGGRIFASTILPKRRTGTLNIFCKIF